MTLADFRHNIRQYPHLTRGITPTTPITDAIYTIADRAGFRKIHHYDILPDVLDELWRFIRTTHKIA